MLVVTRLLNKWRRVYCEVNSHDNRTSITLAPTGRAVEYTYCVRCSKVLRWEEVPMHV